MKNLLKRLRSNYWMSAVLAAIFTPVYRTARFVTYWVPKRIRVNGRKVSYQTLSISFPKNTGISILNKIYWKGDNGYEPIIGILILTLAQKCDLFLDVGSNIGLFSVVAQKSNPRLFSYCFEPVKNLQEKNLKFHEANSCDRFSLIRTALSNSKGVASIIVPDGDEYAETSSASLERDFFYNKNLKRHEETIETDTLDNLIDANKVNIKSSFFMKMDVEGHEMRALEGAKKTIRKYSPPIILELVLSAENIQAFSTFFSNANYTLFEIQEKLLVKAGTDELPVRNGNTNLLMLPNGLVDKPVSFVAQSQLKHWLNSLF